MKNCNFEMSYKQLLSEEGKVIINHSLIDFYKLAQNLPILKEFVPKDILEIGCGGISLFNEWDIGHDRVFSIDISASAVAMAKSNSISNKVTYAVGDICSTEFLHKFDFVLDAHCLHCITDIVDRRFALANILSVLQDHGLFMTEMMVTHDQLFFDDDFHYDKENEILFKKIDSENAYRFQGVMQIEGKCFYPVRKIRSAINIESELLESGFNIVYLKVFENLQIIPHDKRTSGYRGDPQIMRVICTKEKRQETNR